MERQADEEGKKTTYPQTKNEPGSFFKQDAWPLPFRLAPPHEQQSISSQPRANIAKSGKLTLPSLLKSPGTKSKPYVVMPVPAPDFWPSPWGEPIFFDFSAFFCRSAGSFLALNNRSTLIRNGTVKDVQKIRAVFCEWN